MSLEPLDENRCPFCEKLDCNDHLLACFDESGDGEHYVGLIDGPLRSIEELSTIFEHISISWVKWKRAKAKIPIPAWIENEPILLAFFESLKSASIKLKDYKNDDDAAHDLLVDVDSYFKQTLIEDFCSQCGWSRFSEEVYGPDIPLQSTTYLYFYDTKPTVVADKVRLTLQNLIKSSV